MMHLRDVRFPFLLGGLVSLGLVAGGVFLSAFMNLAACPLCIWQRILYLLFSLLSFAGFVGARHRPARRLFGLLMSVTAGTGAGVAGYQVWIQRFAPMTTCGGKEPWWELFVRWAGEKLPLLFEANGLCSDPAWTFFELSIADWSLLMFLSLIALALYAVLMKGYAAR
jgi:disulfide bond formation protein DsbB